MRPLRVLFWRQHTVLYCTCKLKLQDMKKIRKLIIKVKSHQGTIIRDIAQILLRAISCTTFLLLHLKQAMLLERRKRKFSSSIRV